MISGDFLIELSNWGMNVERVRAQAAAQNIANANVTGEVKTVDFEVLIRSVSSAIDSNNLEQARQHFAEAPEMRTTHIDSALGSVAMDSEVADLSSAKGRYKVIAEALSRKFGLMTLASRGQ